MNYKESIYLTLEEREKARNNKDWALADILRIRLNAIGIGIHDTENGQEINELKIPVNPYFQLPIKPDDILYAYRVDIDHWTNPNPIKHYYLSEVKVKQVFKNGFTVHAGIVNNDNAKYNNQGIYHNWEKAYFFVTNKPIDK